MRTRPPLSLQKPKRNKCYHFECELVSDTDDVLAIAGDGANATMGLDLNPDNFVIIKWISANALQHNYKLNLDNIKACVRGDCLLIKVASSLVVFRIKKYVV